MKSTLMHAFSKLGIAMIAALALASCASKTAPDATPSETSTPKGSVERAGVDVGFATIERGSLHGSIDASATVVADAGAQASLAFPVEGQIAEIRAEVGDRVRRGEVLATLDARLGSQAIAQADADLAAARAAFERTRAGARPQELAQNDAALRAARTKAQTAANELARQQSLANVGIASRRDIELARSNAAEAAADFATKEQGGSLLRAGPRSQDIAVAAAGVQQAAVARASAQTRASLGTMVAPIDGVVTSRLKNAGEIVDPASVVLTIVDPARSIVVAQLGERDAALVRDGDRVRITTADRPTPGDGVVMSIGATFASETRTVAARIRPLGSPLTAGTGARVSIFTRDLADAIVVPESSVVKDPDTGRTLVFIPEDPKGTYARVPVTVVLQVGSRIAVRSPRLHPGSRVVSRGAFELLPFAGGGDSG